MTDLYIPPPPAGTEPWDADLNATIDWLHRHVTTLEGTVATQTAAITNLQTSVATLQNRVTALEAKPDYVVNSSSWQFSNAAPPATGNQVRLNNTQASLATQADFRNIDNDGADRSAWFQYLSAGSIIRIQDWNVSATYYRYTVTGPAIIGATNTQVPIAWDKGNGTVPNAKCNVGFIIAVTSF